MAEIAYAFIHLSGGAEGVARRLYNEYTRAPQGGVVRARILDTILRCLKIANDQVPQVSDVGLLSDADIERELEASLHELRKEGGVPIEVGPQDGSGSHEGESQSEDRGAPPV